MDVPSNIAKEKLMKNANNKRTRKGSKALLSTSLFSAAWGGVAGMILLLVATTVPARAATPPPMKANSVVWGSGNSPSTGINSLNLSTTTTGKVAADVKDHLRQDGMVTVIVQHRQMPTSAHFVGMQGRGAVIKSKFNSIRAVTMHVPASMLSELEKDPNVLYVTPDREQKMTANPATEGFASAIQADIAASVYALNGTGIGVAVIDSGISAHPDLNNANGASRVVYSQSFVAGDTSTADKFGHGTHVAGLIGGNGAGSGTANGYAATYAGMASNVNLINLRVLDQNGSGSDSQVIAAIQQAIALKNTYNIRIISMSLGRPIFESYTLDPVDQAVEAAWKAGIVVVCAAGNSGRQGTTKGFGTIGVPANDPAVITVGATMTEGTASRADDKIASYSSKGPTTLDHIVKPDLVAPGNAQVSLRAAGSTLDTTFPQYEVASSNGNAQYFALSGTSMATPVVSGAVALILQQNPALTPDQVKARLMKTAWKAVGQYTSSHDHFGNIYNNEYDLFTYGAGYLDIDAALADTNLATGIALSPTAVVNSNGSITITNTGLGSNFTGSSVVWGSGNSIFANSVVWGSNALSATSVVWGATSVVWGSLSDSGYSVVWGATSNVDSANSALSDGDPGDN